MKMEKVENKKPGGKKGMHHGHSYKETCQCVICKSKRKKMANPVNTEIINFDNTKPIEKGSDDIKIISGIETDEQFYKNKFREEIIKEYHDNLESNKIFFTLHTASEKLFNEKAQKIKEKISAENAEQFIDILMNRSLQFYLHSL